MRERRPLGGGQRAVVIEAQVARRRPVQRLVGVEHVAEEADSQMFTVAALNTCVSDTVALCVSISSPTGKPGTFAPAIDSGFMFELATARVVDEQADRDR